MPTVACIDSAANNINDALKHPATAVASELKIEWTIIALFRDQMPGTGPRRR
jgi:hypothetical protein